MAGSTRMDRLVKRIIRFILGRMKLADRSVRLDSLVGGVVCLMRTTANERSVRSVPGESRAEYVCNERGTYPRAGTQQGYFLQQISSLRALMPARSVQQFVYGKNILSARSLLTRSRWAARFAQTCPTWRATLNDPSGAAPRGPTPDM